jgi:hypothetical protein
MSVSYGFRQDDSLCQDLGTDSGALLRRRIELDGGIVADYRACLLSRRLRFVIAVLRLLSSAIQEYEE